jgi:hypothetical protein
MIDDILFAVGDAQEFILEFSQGSLNAPLDILFGQYGNDIPVNELILACSSATTQETVTFMIV